MANKFDKLGAYDRVSEIVETNNAFVFDVQGPDAKIYFAKVPKNLDSGSSATRQFNAVARHLKKIDSEFINKVIDAGCDDGTGTYFIILEKIENQISLEDYVSKENEVTPGYLKYILQVWYKCSDALEQAALKNIFHKDLHPRNILIKEDKNPVVIDFGISTLEHTISKKPAANEFSNKFSAPELINKEENRLKARSDFYSLAVCMLYALLGHKLFYEDENNENRLKKIVELYKNIISQEGLSDFEIVFTKSFDANPEQRYFRYSELRNAINELFEVINHTAEKPFAIRSADKMYIAEFLREANAEGLSFGINENRHSKYKNVSARVSSANFYAHTCFSSNRGNCLELIGLKKIDSLEENEKANHARTILKGVKLSGINYVQADLNEISIDNFYDVFNFLEKLYQDKQESRPHTLSRTPREILKNYMTLLNEEINYLRDHAFKVRYSDFDVHGSNEASFKIVLDEKVSLENVYNFLKRSQASFRKGNEVALTATTDPTGANNKESVGFSTRFDRETNTLFVKDFPVKRKNDVPHTGYLFEDTSLMEIQYKRQINAIKNYENDNITNPELRKYLFQPDNLKRLADSSGQIIAELNVISVDKKGEKIQFEAAQKDAILKSLYRPPITIIQGPPGTGKTTVITELIRQILSQDNQAKILITSQTNLAVDNVLQKMAKIPGISFIRLGRNIEDAEINQHSFENKLNLWARKTKSASEKNFLELKRAVESSEKKHSPVLNLIVQEVNKKQDWNVTKKSLKQILTGAFAKGFEDLYDFIDNKILFQNELAKYLGEKHARLNTLDLLKRRWHALLSNIEDYDALKSKFISSINIVGATSNHIAAGKYKNFHFEFDYVIMDEAAKATPAETLVPINMAHNLVLVGDHKQLPPLVTATKKVIEQVESKLNNDGEMVDFDKVYYDQPSLFEIMYDGSPDEFKEMLDLQFRMPKQVGNIISDLVYEKKLKSNERSGKKHEINLKATTAMFMVNINKYPNRFHQVDPVSKSSYNPVSAKTVLEILSKLDTYSELFTGKEYEIGVITGYGKQAEYLSNEIENFHFKNLHLNKNLAVATVDSFQGSEKDIIIYDIVRSAKSKDDTGLGFLEMPNRINVALTRVTRLLIVVGDAEYILNVNPSYRWINSNPNEPLLLKEFVSHLHEAGFIYDNPTDIFYG